MATETAAPYPELSHRFVGWARRVGLSRKLAIALALAAVASGTATYIALTGASPFGPEPRTVLVSMLTNLVLLLLLGALVARRLVKLWAERRRGLAGSRLHTRTVAMFSLVAVAPAIIITVFSALFLNFGIQSWFSDRVRTALAESVYVAEAYLGEHRKVIRADVLAMANDLNRSADLLSRNPARFGQVVTGQAALRSLAEAIVFDRSGRVLARSPFSFALEFEQLPEEALERAGTGEVVLFTSDSDDRVRALIRLDRYLDAYLFVGRFVDPRVINSVERNRRATAAYEQLAEDRSRIEITFVLIFIVVTLLLLLVAVWFATRLVRPISSLVDAAEQVRAGNLGVRVPERDDDDELGSLSRAFNRMTNQLNGQREELIEANRQLDLRRRFTEAVLSGVSAGVIGLGPDGRITLPNRSASSLLDAESEALVGKDFAATVPEMAGLLDEARQRPERLAQGQVTLVSRGSTRTLLVRVTAESVGGEIQGIVVTFDDITDLLSAQRTAAWADVARRIAHEIKNPLTPIQLSAERLKRKYLKEIVTDRETFSRCTDTIIRQAADIGRMVDEFSSFARMPAPVFREEDLTELARRAEFLQQLAYPEITYHHSFPTPPVLLRCDGRQISQVLTNLLQNAADAIHGVAGEHGSTHAPGRIEVVIERVEDQVVLEVADNGCGLPDGPPERLTEPYVTTRDKGTGLGLAIVKKIIDDHGGRLILDDRPDGGTRVRLILDVEAASPHQESTAPASHHDKLVSHGS